MDIDSDSVQVSRLEVINTGRRRRWSVSEKRRIVEESLSGQAGQLGEAPRSLTHCARRRGFHMIAGAPRPASGARVAHAPVDLMLLGRTMERNTASTGTAGTAPPAEDAAAVPPVPPGYYRCRWRRGLMALGFVCVGLGAVGVVVPVMPTTVFLLVALWAFSRSSERFHLWLWNHRRFGPPLRNWHRHRVISPRAKALAVGTMGASLAWVGLGIAETWLLPAAVAAAMAPPAAFILTRPGRPPRG
jgi:hypothetical protein